jgi:sigma-B regulation protein RsbU (phosphoserine phosphatase)
LILAVGDVSGKGAGAAMLMSNVQAALRTATFISSGTGLGEIITYLNDLIYGNSQPDQFITLFAALYDDDEHTLEFINAGHNPPLLARADGQILELQEGGILLGAVPGMTYEKGKERLGTGDVFCLYTDGITEAWNDHNEMYGEERLKGFLLSQRENEAEDILRNLEKEVIQFTEGRPLSDDFTVIVAKVK